MKRNVDLTENRVFANSSSPMEPTLNFLLNGKYPWDTENDVFEEISSDELFFTGSKKERMRKRRNSEYRHFLGCDRCGISLKPWKIFDTLCPACSEDLDKSKTLNELFNISW